jgi:hypothetical protein
MRAREDSGGPIAHPGAAPAGRVREARLRRRLRRLQHPHPRRAPKRGQRRRRRPVRKRHDRVSPVSPAAAARFNGGERRAPNGPKLLRLRHQHRPRVAVSFSAGAIHGRNGRKRHRRHRRGSILSRGQHSDSRAGLSRAISRPSRRQRHHQCRHCRRQFKHCPRQFRHCRRR